MGYTGHYDGSCPECETREVEEVFRQEEGGEMWITYVCENDHEYEISYEGYVEDVVA